MTYINVRVCEQYILEQLLELRFSRAGMSAKQMYEEQKKILAKLTAEQDGDMKELSHVMSNVLSNMYKQLERVIKEKTEVERETNS